MNMLRFRCDTPKKNFITLNIAILFLLTSALIVMPMSLYADAGTWVDGDFPKLTINGPLSATVEPPDCYQTTFTYHSYTKTNGTSPDSVGRDISESVCATENGLGFFGGGNGNYWFVRPNTTTAFHVVSPSYRLLALTPVPNQSTFIYMDSSVSFHGEVTPHFYDSLAGSGSFGKYGIAGGSYLVDELAYRLESPGVLLKDNVGNTIYMHAAAFSRNGHWMAIEAVGLGLVRVDTQTRTMQLFDRAQFAYNMGFRPSLTLAISDDGNTVIKSGVDAGDTTVYDLSACQPASFTVGANNSAAIQGCRYRVVQQSLNQQLSGFRSLSAMHFSADGKSVSVTASRISATGTYDYFSATYAVAGYQMPHTTYLALGDSFSSGEGAHDYVQGTDVTDPTNMCHLSTHSYPYLAAANLGITDFHSVACSGATTKNYFDSAQYDNVKQFIWLPGEVSQELFTAFASPNIVSISMIGNDIGFKDKLTTCLSPLDNCFHYREERQIVADEIYGKFDTLVKLYKDIKKDSGNPDAVKVYVLGYPQIVGTDTCQNNVHLSLEERQMAQGLVGYLNVVIKAAAARAGVKYIDVEHAFDGHRLCDTDQDNVAVNGLERGTDSSTIITVGPVNYRVPVSNGSFHPNAYGHQLLAQALLTQSHNLTDVMPAADTSIITPPQVGSSAYSAFVNDAPAINVQSVLGDPYFYISTFKIAQTAQRLLQKDWSLNIDLQDTIFAPNSSVNVVFNSNPTLGGTLATDAHGKLTGSVSVPDSVNPGYHIVHLIGKSIDGQNVDYYQNIFVAASALDVNGDGISDSQQQCIVVPDSGIDQDKDGIDDACDAEITAPPADVTPPLVTGTVDRQPDHNGWYNHDATISWTATDPQPSSGASTQPEQTVVDQEGIYTYTSTPSCDPAGNCAHGAMELRLDTVAPDITFEISPAPNSKGWNNSAVTVSFVCNDATSGVESCTSPVTVSGDSGGYVVTGTAIDNAGNSSSVNAVVSIDSTAPSVKNAASPSANANGWNNTDVTVSTSCEDNLSRVATCSGPVTLTTEGPNQQVTGVGVDNADNVASASTIVNIDKTAPTIGGWQWSGNPKATTGPATLTVRTSDSLSGVVRAEYFLGDTDPGLGNGATLQASGSDYTISFGADFPTGVYKVNMRTEDAAGNWSAVSSDYLVVYNPFSVRMTGRRFLLPSIANGDALTGLVGAGQLDAAKFGFSIGYDAQGNMLPNNDFQFAYSTGTQCNNPAKAQNCHSFSLNATSVSWFTTEGTNNATGIFFGKATLAIDGNMQQVTFMLTGLDADLLGSNGPDHLKLYVYRVGDNPSSATPIYQVDDDLLHGSIHIKCNVI